MECVLKLFSVLAEFQPFMELKQFINSLNKFEDIERNS